MPGPPNLNRADRFAAFIMPSDPIRTERTMSDHDPVDRVDDTAPDLTEEEADFDLGIDVAQPQVPHGSASFDIVNGLGYGNVPEEA